jgi:hypothetical protein
MVTCDNIKCVHNEHNICNLKDISIIDVTCVSRRKQETEINYQSLMKSSEPTGCKRNGKWVRN